MDRFIKQIVCIFLLTTHTHMAHMAQSSAQETSNQNNSSATYNLTSVTHMNGPDYHISSFGDVLFKKKVWSKVKMGMSPRQKLTIFFFNSCGAVTPDCHRVANKQNS